MRKQYKKLELNIYFQGGPQFRGGYILVENDELVLAIVHADIKNYEVMTYGHCKGEPPSIQMVFRSDVQDYDKKEALGHTSISFPQFVGWRVWMAEMQRYDLQVLFVKDSVLGF